MVFRKEKRPERQFGNNSLGSPVPKTGMSPNGDTLLDASPLEVSEEDLSSANPPPPPTHPDDIDISIWTNGAFRAQCMLTILN